MDEGAYWESGRCPVCEDGTCWRCTVPEDGGEA